MDRFFIKVTWMIVVLLLASNVYGQKKYYPYSLGYAGSKQVTSGATKNYILSTGTPFLSAWADSLDKGRVLAGFYPKLSFVEDAFEEDLFCSKGYFPDYVELKWDLVRYSSRVERFRVLRRELKNQTAVFKQVASLSREARSWRDEQSEAGVIYEYKLIADGITVAQQKYLNFIDGVGFRLPLGRVSGRVVFDGGGAVPGVHLIAETDDSFSDKSLRLIGTGSYVDIPGVDQSILAFDTAMTFQGWFLPEYTAGGDRTLFQKGGQYKLSHQPGKVTFKAGAISIELPFQQNKPDTFFHVAAMRTKDSLKLFVKYDESTVYKKAVAFSGTTPANQDTIFIGRDAAKQGYFTGYVDEIRIWQKSFNSDLALLNQSEQVISGNEKNLSAYFRINEGIGNTIFDLSRDGFNFHELHGNTHLAQWSDKVPHKNQLAVKGITDASGNYIISGIPFSTDGNLYKIVPTFGVHGFDPKDKSVFVGPGESTHNGIDFIDISSFPASGQIFYANTDFPVKDVEIKIDGQFALNKNGNIVKTDVNGSFTVDVPIGEHYLEFVKNGHVFKDGGRFPYDAANSNKTFEFTGAYTFQPRTIEDITTVKVIGRVAGGPVEAAKAPGLGQTKANVGKATIKLGTERNANLIRETATADAVSTTPNSFYDNSNTLKTTAVPTTKTTISLTNRRVITIEPDQNTGEFAVYLLPEKYTVNSMVFDVPLYGNQTSKFSAVLDLTNSFANKTIIDTTSFGPLEIDSVHYNHRRDFILRTEPVLSVLAKDGTPAFWERKLTVGSTEINVVNADGSPKTGNFGLFKQRNLYEATIKVFESYTNGTDVEQVPVTDGKVKIKNALAINDEEITLNFDNKGEAKYSFKAGLPSITGDKIAAKSLSIIAETGQGGVIKTPWTYKGDVFQGYILGGRPTGNNFVTAGPNTVEMILRDPPGSQSSATYAKGNSKQTSSSTDVTSATNSNVELEVNLGLDIEFSSGFGVEKTTEIDLTLDQTAGIQMEQAYGTNNTMVRTVTSTQTWSTSSEPDFVGAMGDLFIGYSSNIVYGTASNSTVLAASECTSPDCIDIAGTGYKIGVKKSLRVSPSFGTGFQYTQNHIKNYLIPNLTELRNLYFKNSKWHTPQPGIVEGHENYGKNNPVDEVITDNTFQRKIGGSYYTYTLNFADPNATNYWPDSDSLFIDSVVFYNQQIAGWEQVLWQNEKEKVLSKLEKNLSYDAGVVLTNEVTFENSNSTTTTFDFTVSPTVARSVGLSVDGVGSKLTISETKTLGKSTAEGFVNTSSQTFGYTLQDTDVGDYFSVDVRDPKSGNGAVFALKGGQSSCPYEDQEVTEYYAPLGREISAATQQREVPKISCAQPTQINIPEDKPANFNVKLQNNSESGDPFWFVITVDEQSNQGGALIKLDGAPILNGRSILVPEGTILNKVISIEKVDPGVFDYENIGIILRSDCQFDPTDDLPDIADTVKLSAYFQPVCSGVELTAPLNQWVRNTNTQDEDGNTFLPVEIAGYDLAHTGFNKVILEYKPSSSSQWTQIMNFFTNDADYNTAIGAGQNAQKINGAPKINFDWDMTDLFDRQYDLRATTSCVTGETNSSSILTGLKDTKRPKIFGSPQPGDGILSPGEDIKIKFDEDIQAGLLLSPNFSVRGVLNDAEIRHDASLFFDGVNDHASNTAGVNLSEKSFSIEFWTKRASLNSGVIFSQGDVELGFNGNKFYAKLGSQNFSPQEDFNFTNKWIHFTVSFDYENNLLHVYAAYDGRGNGVALADAPVNGGLVFNGEGRLIFGASKSVDNFYNGFLHDVRIWNKVIGQGTSAAERLTQFKGDEIGLAGLWPMTELSGEIANDLARSHNVTLKEGTAWKVSPGGYAREFGGSGNLSIKTAKTVAITDEMDFTIEMWFRGEAQANTILFANGKADGTEAPEAFEDIWKIGFNETGKLYFKNNGITVSDANNNYLDGEWHHVAVVMRRKANTILYVDGSNVGFAASSSLGGLKGSRMSIGASQKYGSNDNFSHYFKGGIDEFRIWTLARTKKLLELDLHSKLKGDEEGLAAYYPFDRFNAILELEGTLISGTEVPDTAIANGVGNFTDANVPLITQARPVQSLNFDWVVNEDEVIINILEPAALVEKQVIEITIQGVEDLNENRLASPEAWTAFIKQNTVIWDKKSLEFEKLVYEPLSFQVDIVNIGGVEEDYTISNIPAWLSVSDALGSLAPDSRKTISFTVDPSINIGNYEEVLYLTTDFGFNEAFYLKIKVVGEEPDWIINPSDFQFSMNIVGMVRVDGVVSADEDDMLAAFVGNELRGVSRLAYIEEYDSYMALLDVYSRTPDGDKLSFKIWDASEGKVHVEVTPELDFVADNLIGSPANPQFFDAINIIEYPIPLNKGWNWISFPLNSKNRNDIGKLMGDLNVNNGDQIKSLRYFDQYSSQVGWVGNLTASGGVNSRELYKMYVSNTDTIDFSGAKLNTEAEQITISKGWNWLGAPFLHNLSVSNAFSNFTPTHGDLIKGQVGFSIYDDKIGWIGTLEFLKPRAGYMFKSATNGVLQFPNAELYKSAGSLKEDEIRALVDAYAVDVNRFQNNMTLIGQLQDSSDVIDEALLVAYAGDDVRGVSPLIQGKFFINLFSSITGEELAFVIVDQNSKEYKTAQTVVFANDSMVGSVRNPYQFTVTGIYDGPGERGLVAGENGIIAFPTVFDDEINVHLTLDEKTEVKAILQDVSGRTLSTLFEATHGAGDHKLKWTNVFGSSNMPQGVLLLRIFYNEQPVFQTRLVHIKK